MTAATEGPVVLAEGVVRRFPSGERELEVLRGVDLSLAPGEIAAIVGPSGSGKSTLLHCLGGLDRPTAGRVSIAGQDLSRLDDTALARVRSRDVGFVFQFHHLLPDFDALENVMLPMLIAGRSPSAAQERARELLHTVGLGERIAHAPGELSGGEQQRVAVARSLANDPAIVLADEPSGNLDAANSVALHELLERLRREHGATFLLATHDSELASRADRVLEMRDGRLEGHSVARRQPAAPGAPA
ncbi:MAG TPA: ABC transporter ATP-binding protein [bacterium]|nr:ABC transporter ATP-binding protein [bacterium]